jgi:hypothetical protein
MPDDDPDIPDLVDGVPIDEAGDATNGEAADVPGEVDEAEADTDGTDDTADGSSGGTAAVSLLRAPNADAAPNVDVTDDVRIPARYKAIHEARTSAVEAFRDLSKRRMQAYEAAQNYPPENARAFADRLVESHLRDTVRAYVSEVEPLITRIEDVADWYWTEVPLGKIEFDELMVQVQEEPPGLNRGAPVEIEEHKMPEPVKFEGLRDFVTAQDEYTRSLTVEFEPPGTAYGTEQRVEKTTVIMPTEISRAAFRVTNTFLADIGLDLSPAEAAGDAGISLSDIR